MDMTPIDTRNARVLDTTVVAIDRPLGTSELVIGLLYAVLFIPMLFARAMFHVLGSQVSLLGRALKACAEEVARARRG